MSPHLHPEIIEFAYLKGYFPMPHPDTGEILWFDPDPRAIIPLDQFHASRSLRKSARHKGFRITLNLAFAQVVERCADRPETWITEDFKSMYYQMHNQRIAHSVEVWSGEVLAGGVFGLKFGGVFNAESMFSVQTDASKVALWALTVAMKRAGMQILEVQFMTDHLRSLGAIGIAKAEYHRMQEAASRLRCSLDESHFERWLETT